jgi:hypothetical protein
VEVIAGNALPVAVAELPKGIYSLQAITANKKETVKFIKH